MGDRTGEVSFQEVDNCGETSAVVTSGGFTRNTTLVSLTTLDEEFWNADVQIDYLKIDTEGYDLKVLLGAERLLTEGRIRFIQFEYNSQWLATGSTLRVAIDYLGQFGYEVFVIQQRGLSKFEYARWGDYFRYSNFFACTSADVSALKDMVSDVP
jgi:hypothetical protein